MGGWVCGRLIAKGTWGRGRARDDVREASVRVMSGQSFRGRRGLPRLSSEIKVPELTGAHDPRGAGDEVHALKLRCDIPD